MDKYPGKFQFSVSYTTRGPRPGEEHGKHYFFVSKEEFQKGIDAGDFLEHVEYSGNCYGTNRKYIQSIQEKGIICILDIDIKGAEKLINNGLDAYVLFLEPPSLEALQQRLEGRGTETPEAINKRVTTAREELEASRTKPWINKRILNNDLDACVEDVVMALQDLYPTQDF